MALAGVERQRRAARAPRQARSRDRRERLLESAEALAAERGFEAAGVAEIARSAGCSVGAFYAHFPDKRALLHALDERFHERATAQLDALLEPARADALALPALLHDVARALVALHRRQRGLARALVAEAQRDPSFQTLRDALAQRLIRQLSQRIAGRSGELAHHHPERAIAFGVAVVLGCVEGAVLFERLRSAAGLTPSDDDLATELARLLRSYLGVPTAG